MSSTIGSLPAAAAVVATAFFGSAQGWSSWTVVGLLALAVVACVGGLVVGARVRMVIVCGAIAAGALTALALADGDEPGWAALDLTVAGAALGVVTSRRPGLVPAALGAAGAAVLAIAVSPTVAVLAAAGTALVTAVVMARPASSIVDS